MFTKVQSLSGWDDSVNGPRYQDYLYIEKQKELWRVGIANYFNKCGYEKWLIDAAMGNSMQMANLLNHSGISPGRAQKAGFLSVARAFTPLIGTAAEMRQQDDDHRMREWENLNRLNSLVKIDVANELNEKGIEAGTAINTLKIQDSIQYANALNGLGVELETAIQLALEVKPLEFQFNPKGVFGDEKHGLNKFMSDLGRRFEIHHWKSTQNIAKPLTKASEKKIKQEFENAIQEIETQRAKYLNEVDIAAANQRNLLQWQYGKGLSDDQIYQINYVETYTALDEMRAQLIEIDLEAANAISNVLGKMQCEKSKHDVDFLNWKQDFESAETEIQFSYFKKKLEIEHFCSKRVHALRQECQKTLEKVRRKGTKKLVAIVGTAFLAPQMAAQLATTLGTGLGVTSATTQSALAGALTGMAFSGVTGVLSGDTKDLAKNMFKGAVLGGVGGYVGEYAKSIEALKQSNNLKTIFVASVKATAGRLINHDKLGQSLVTSIFEGLLLDSVSSDTSGIQNIPTEFLDILKSAMLKAAASAFVDALINGGSLDDKLATSGVMALFQSIGTYAGQEFSLQLDKWQKLKEWREQVELEKELDALDMTPQKALKTTENEENPKRLLLQYNAILNKAKKLSAEGNQIEANNYLNAAEVTSNKYQTINSKINTLGVVILEKDSNSFISKGHGLFYIKDHKGDLIYYENTVSGDGFNGGVRRLTQEEYQSIYGHRAFLVKEVYLDQTQHNNVIDYINKRLSSGSYQLLDNNCIHFIKDTLTASGLDIFLKDMFNREQLNSLNVEVGFVNHVMSNNNLEREAFDNAESVRNDFRTNFTMGNI